MRSDGPGLLADPQQRAAAIVDYDLDHPIEDLHLDAICRTIARQCGVPIALVSLVDEAEQRFLGRSGTDWASTPRSTSFCATAMLHPGITVVPDAQRDPRFADFAIVRDDPHIRFYAGAPLTTPEGVPLGALCLLDTRSHEALPDAQAELLLLMAAAVMDHLALRRARRTGQLAAHDAAVALGESEMRFRLLADTMPQIAWSSRADGHSDYFNARWYEFTGLPEGASDGRNWLDSLHPEDLDRTVTAWRACVASGDAYDIEFRLRRADGDYRWTLTRGLPMRGEDGRILRWFGTCTDIHDRQNALEEREVISQELSHRIKNIFAVISGLIGLSARDRPEFRDHAEALRDRILALGRAHDFVRPHSRDALPGPALQNSLAGLLSEIFAPYQTGSSTRIHFTGADMAIDDRSATPLALLFHEVVTNAAKYGALSVPDGRVDLTVAIGSGEDAVVDMLWQESGGPRLEAAIPSSGFGSRLLDLSIRRQLGGDFQQDWVPEGLTMRITVPCRAFSRSRTG